MAIARCCNDMRDLGERCGKHRVARLMRLAGLRPAGYGASSRHFGGKPAVVAPNHLQRQFKLCSAQQGWVTDITYIRTHEGWLYLAVVLDLFSRQVVGWSMGERMTPIWCCNALLMALWRRKPKAPR
jgi:putative transposase